MRFPSGGPSFGLCSTLVDTVGLAQGRRWECKSGVLINIHKNPSQNVGVVYNYLECINHPRHRSVSIRYNVIIVCATMYNVFSDLTAKSRVIMADTSL